MRSIPRAQIDTIRAYIHSKAGLPYHYGGSGNPGGDCSWFAYAPAAMLAGLPANRRYGSTEAYNVAAGWENPDARLGLVRSTKGRAGVPADAVLKLGFKHGGGGYNSHVSGTFDGLNYESRGMYKGVSGHVVGGTARAWNDPLYQDFWYLPARVGAGNPDDFPLPAGWYYGPRSGPEESVSGEVGEPEYQIVGIRHMQAKLGIPQTGRWADAQPAIAALQRTDPSLIPDGTVGPKTWALIMRLGSTPPAPAPPPAPLPGGPAVSMTFEQHAAAQWGQPHPVRPMSETGRNYVNVKDGEMWGRAGLADIWNETVWDGFRSHVDGDDRTGSLIFWLLETHRETVELKDLVASLQARAASGDAIQQSNAQEGE